MASFGERMKQLRLEHDKTLDEMKIILQTTKATLSRYENNKGRPNIEFAKKVADYFGVTIDYLNGSNNNKNSTEDSINKNITKDDIIELANQLGVTGVKVLRNYPKIN